jgi:hypothetical protein
LMMCDRLPSVALYLARVMELNEALHSQRTRKNTEEGLRNIVRPVLSVCEVGREGGTI